MQCVALCCVCGLYNSVNILMTLCRYCFLSLDNRVADRAVLTLCKTCLCAGCFYRLVDYFRMSLSRYNFLCLDNRVTNRAVLALCKTCLCAGCGYCLVNYFCVTKRLYSLCFNLFANRAGSYLSTCCRTGWFFCYHPVTKCMCCAFNRIGYRNYSETIFVI